MTLSMYQASAPVFLRALTNLQHVLRKGEAHAQARKFDPELLLQARLSPDMLPLTRQVQIATDMAKNGCARLAGVDPMKFEDTETTFAELHARIERAIDYIKSFKAEQIDGSETREVTIKTRTGEQQFEGQGYLLHFVIPNLFFHCTTTYAVLRQAGVELGKMDFIGKP
ncbi:DUF1993 domain-containing protein [Dyella soli]|uniref:DUF1993 domain-containing protein n=1 Tax=Dyella soli TaxID=522319 RepID=A0A4R0YKJ1_9GAMM|nr:DUF1993 domain-containing protein [Dyella soli]TCI06514.1 DUF1993 domain-containing protein [Dyella soli]